MTTPTPANRYQLPSYPPTNWTVELWNQIFGSIADRLDEREALEASFELLQSQGVQSALDYIQVTIAPHLSSLQDEITAAQLAIDAIINEGTAPNSEKLGGELPSFYATATALAEGLAGLQSAIDGVVGGAPPELDTLGKIAQSLETKANAQEMTASLAQKLPIAGGALTGRLQSAPGQGTGDNNMATAAGSLGEIEVRGNDIGAAMMAFVGPEGYAGYFGLDIDNKWKVGGWSMGEISHQIWHEGNDGVGSGLDADKLDGQEGSYYSDVTARLGYAPLDSAGGAMSGTIALTGGANTTYALDSAARKVTVANGGLIEIVHNFSGVVIVNSHTNGFVEVFACGAGSTSRFASSSGSTGINAVHASDQDGYAFYNNSGSIQTISLMAFRTRGSA